MKKFGVDVIFDEVVRIDLVECVYYEGLCKFIVKIVNGKEYKVRMIIIVVGVVLRKLRVFGEEEFIGKGVFYCVICDGLFFKGKKVIVVGGGNIVF